MLRPFALILTVAGLLAWPGADDAFAQAKPRPRPRPRQAIEAGGFATFGNINFTAADSFDVILGSPSGVIFGGGIRLVDPPTGFFIDVGGWWFQDDGERVFISEGEEFRLGIPVKVRLTPIELTAGWRPRFRAAPRILPYVGGGYTSFGYKETSDFATDEENVNERFHGYHVLGGIEIRVIRWLGVAGEAAWTTVPKAIGESGVSAVFDETDLGGTSFRVRLTFGQ